jgi:hypothetical protein
MEMQLLIDRALVVRNLRTKNDEGVSLVDAVSPIDVVSHIVRLESDSNKYFQSLFPTHERLIWFGKYIITQLSSGNTYPMTTFISSTDIETFKRYEPFSNNLVFTQNSNGSITVSFKNQG